MRAVINAYTTAFRAGKILYHSVAFLCVVAVGASIYHGHMSGYVTFPLGTEVASIDGADVLPVAVAQNTIPLPQHKPKVPK